MRSTNQSPAAHNLLQYQTHSVRLPLLRRHDLVARHPVIHVGICAHDNPIPTAPSTRTPRVPLHLMRRSNLPDSLLLIRQFPRVFISRDAPVVAVVILKCIWLLAVDGIVANLAHLVRHAEGHAANVLDETHDEGGPDDVPADDEEGADDLEADLATVAGDGAARVGDAEGEAAFLSGPETCDLLILGGSVRLTGERERK